MNALQAMPEVGTLLLASGDREDGGIKGGFVAFGDSGPGITPKDRECLELFAPFFTTKTSDGTGLDLWVSLGLVQRYGGRIDAVCPPGGGSVFTVWLPNEAATA